MIRVYILIFLILSVFAGNAQNTAAEKEMPALKSVFDKYNMNGTIMIMDQRTGTMTGYNKTLWDTGYLPASTFKIANSLIGLETGVIDTGTIFKWKGEKRRLPQWEKDLSVAEAFRVSCVPCYQEVARKIGAGRMNFYLELLHYGKMIVTDSTIDLFWLEGDSRITPREQVDFMRRLFENKLPLSVDAMNSVKMFMLQEDSCPIRISGKTGWAIRNGNNYGWFVGYLETGESVYFVAALIIPKNQDQITDFAMARKTVTLDVFKMLGLIPEKY